MTVPAISTANLPTELATALADRGLRDPGTEVGPLIRYRAGYFGTGTRLHLWVGHPDHGWWCVCGGVSWVWNRTNPQRSPEDVPNAEGKVNCYRCAKAVGLIDEYPGRDERRRREEEERWP